MQSWHTLLGGLMRRAAVRAARARSLSQAKLRPPNLTKPEAADVHDGEDGDIGVSSLLADDQEDRDQRQEEEEEDEDSFSKESVRATLAAGQLAQHNYHGEHYHCNKTMYSMQQAINTLEQANNELTGKITDFVEKEDAREKERQTWVQERVAMLEAHDKEKELWGKEGALLQQRIQGVESERDALQQQVSGLSEAKQRIEQVADKLNEKVSRVAGESKQSYDSLKTAVEEGTRKQQHMALQVKTLQAKIASIQAEKASLQHKEQSSQARYAHTKNKLQSYIEQWKQQAEEYKTRYYSAKSRVEHLSKEADQIRAKLLQQKLDSEKEAHELRSSIKQLTAQVSSIEGGATDVIQSMQQENAALSEKHANVLSDFTKFKASAVPLEQVELLREEIRSVERDGDSFKMHISGLEKVNEELETENQRLTAACASTRAELASVQEQLILLQYSKSKDDSDFGSSLWEEECTKLQEENAILEAKLLRLTAHDHQH